MDSLIMKISPVIIKLGSFEIRWYAICILVGALVTYFFAQRAMIKAGHPKAVFENLFLVAFPSGLIGARLWWCIADSGSPWKDGDILGFFRVWEGGLAIQGGVLLGAGVGIAVMLWKYKQVNVFFAMDAAISNILIAQAIGRWGNFFNQEVYGGCVDSSKLSFLPKFIQNQMESGNGGFGSYVGTGIACPVGESAQPLFLYEALINIVGWVVISLVLRKFWKKGRRLGDLSGLYLVWYGICRACLEPLRNSSYIMNGLGGWSVSFYTSLLFIAIGIVFIVLLRVFDRNKKLKVE